MFSVFSPYGTYNPRSNLTLADQVGQTSFVMPKNYANMGRFLLASKESLSPGWAIWELPVVCGDRTWAEGEAGGGRAGISWGTWELQSRRQKP